MKLAVGSVFKCMIQWHWVHSQCWIINPVIHFWNVFITQNCNHWAVTTHFLFSFAPGHVSSTFYLCICLSRYLVKSCNSCLFVSGAFHLMSSKKTKHNIFKFHPCFSLCQNFIAVSGWIAVHMCVTFYLSIYGWTLGLSHLIFSEGTEVLSRSGSPHYLSGSRIRETESPAS